MEDIMQFAQFVLGFVSTNCYLMHNRKEAVVFDPGGEPGEILTYIKNNNLKLTHIFNTHMHFDHVFGNRALSAATGAPVLANSRDDYLVSSDSSTAAFGVPPIPKFTYANIDAGEMVVLDTPMQILSTPGHTPGSLSFYLPEHGKLFSGDVLFYRAVGRTDFEGGDTRTLLTSIKEKLYTLPDDTIVYAGHELATTIGGEKKYNPYVRGN
jgi:glyoxylase-like metal-dependent hydrolase (beta-lactamase superfamily II)